MKRIMLMLIAVMLLTGAPALLAQTNNAKKHKHTLHEGMWVGVRETAQGFAAGTVAIVRSLGTAGYEVADARLRDLDAVPQTAWRGIRQLAKTPARAWWLARHL